MLTTESKQYCLAISTTQCNIACTQTVMFKVSLKPNNLQLSIGFNL